MSEKYIIGIDIGGTKISGGLFTNTGDLNFTVTLPTMADKSKNTVINQIITTIEELLAVKSLSIQNIKGLGVCAPGPLNPITGEILNPPNLPTLHNTNLKEIIEHNYNTNVLIENDANAAGLAELKIGAAKGCKNILYVTVSTGIGTGIIIDGKIYHGKNGFAGEGGHLSTNYKENIYCNCNTPGCIESIASGTAIARIAKELIISGKANDSLLKTFEDKLELLTAKEVATLALKSDQLCRNIICEAAQNIGAWLGGMINLLDPDMIVIGGGVSMIGDLFFDNIRSTALKFTYNPYASQTPVVPAMLKKEVGIRGAASLFID